MTEITDLSGLSDEISRLPGDWYAAHTKVGSEKMAKANLERRVENLGLDTLIFQVEVPTREVASVKSGQRKVASQTVMPGYVLIRMDLTDESWAAVKNTPGISGFISATTLPTPLPLADVAKLLLPAPLQEDDVVPECDLAAGSAVTVTDGPFAGYSASVRDVDLERERVTVLVSIFGRETPVDLCLNQIERI